MENKRTCPHCGSKLGEETKFNTYYECGTVFPYDFDETRSELCKELEAKRLLLTSAPEVPVKKPRARKAKKTNPTQELLDALKFVSQASAKKGTPGQTHCRIENGMLRAFNGEICIGIPVREDLQGACPHTFNLIDALSKIEGSVSITLVSEHELCVTSGNLSVSVGCSEVETPTPNPNVYHISDTVKDALAFVAPFPRGDTNNLVRSSVLLQSGSAVATCGMVVGEYWHGQDLPTMLLPKPLAKVVGNAPFALSGFGYDGKTATFWFDNGAYVFCNILEANYINYRQVMDTELRPAKIPKGFFKALNVFSKSYDDDICEFNEAGILARPKNSNVNSLYKVGGGLPPMRFIMKQLLQAEKMETFVFDEVNNCARFFSEKARIAVKALDKE